MSIFLIREVAFNAATASVELTQKILTEYPEAEIHPRALPVADQDVSLEVVLPLSMREIYDARDRIYDQIIELQDRYGV